MSFAVIDQLRSMFATLTSSHFVRNVAVVGGGIAAAQAITLVFMPIITRLYGPEAFGISAAFAALVSIITPLATLGYANAIVMPKSDADAAAVARLSILCGLTLASLSLLVVHFCSPWLAILTGLEQSPMMLYLISISLLFSAFLSVANQATIREGLFKAKARAYVESSLITNFGKLAGGLIAPSGLLLIVITMAGQVLNFVIQLLRVSRSDILKPRNWFGFGGAYEAAMVHKEFALYKMPQSILNAASVGLPVILLSSMFGTAAAGQYSLAAAVLAAPLILLGQAVGEVFYPKITRTIERKSPRARELLIKSTLGLTAAAIIPFGITMLWGDYLFLLIFGSEWRLAGEYAQWLSLWLAAALASRACLSAAPALGLQGFMLMREIASVFLRTGALYLGFIWQHSDVVAVALFSLAGTVINISIIYAAYSRLIHISQTWVPLKGN